MDEQTIVLMLIGGLSIMTLLTAWGITCQLNAMRQRSALLGAVADEVRRRMATGEQWLALFSGFERVSHDAHVLSLMSFGDPRKLYPKDIADLWPA